MINYGYQGLRQDKVDDYGMIVEIMGERTKKDFPKFFLCNNSQSRGDFIGNSCVFPP